MCGMYIINGVHGPEPRLSGGNNVYIDDTPNVHVKSETHCSDKKFCCEEIVACYIVTVIDIGLVDIKRSCACWHRPVLARKRIHQCDQNQESIRNHWMFVIHYDLTFDIIIDFVFTEV